MFRSPTDLIDVLYYWRELSDLMACCFSSTTYDILARGQKVEQSMGRVGVVSDHLDGSAQEHEGCRFPMNGRKVYIYIYGIFLMLLTTLWGNLWSEAEQLPCQTERLLVRMLLIVPL